MATSPNMNGTAPEAGRELVARYLHEAHATETALVTTLQAHAAMAPSGTYRNLLERHLDETHGHADAIEDRLAEFDAGTSVVDTAVGLVETLVGQALALGKGPLDLLRGTSHAEKLLKNAKDECATEALEIATYDALEVAAEAVGDAETAALARRHRAEEERMLADLRAELPALTEAVVRERTGGAPPATAPAEDRSEEEPIPGYDTLNAGQVIARLPDLSAEQLDAVAQRERAGRARSTVLSRIDLLRREADGSAAQDLGRARS